MAVRTQETQVFGAVVAPISVYVIQPDRNATRGRVSLTPSTPRTVLRGYVSGNA
jgi:hypothetical protein